MNCKRLKSITIITVAVACVFALSFFVFNSFETVFADDGISVAGNLIYGENITLTLNRESEADSYYWDYFSNGTYFACGGDNESKTYSFTADFTGGRVFRCIYEKRGVTYYERVNVNVAKRPIRLKLNKAEAFYGEEAELALVVDDALDETNFGIADWDSVNLFDYHIDLTTCGMKTVEVYTSSSDYSAVCIDNTFNYKRRPIVLSIVYSEYEYGDEIYPALKLADSTQSMGLVSGDSITMFNDSVAFNVEYGDKPLGIKTVTGTCNNGYIGKYTIVDIESGQVLIKAKRVDIRLIDTTINYGDEVSSGFNVDGLAAGDNRNLFVLEFKSNVTGLGKFPIDARVDSCPECYIVDKIYGATLTVVKRKIVFDVAVTKIYGEDYVFSCDYANNSRRILNSDVNDIEITIVYDDGVVCSATGKEEFYDILFEVADILYLPRPLEIVLADATVEYGNVTFDLSVESYDGLIEGDVLPVLTCATQYSDCGEYVLDATYYSNENYTINIVTAVLTVVPRRISVTIDDKNILYGQAERALTYAITSGTVVYGDDIAIKLERDAGDDAGEYEIRGSCLNSNYSVEFINGKYVVEKGVLNINFVEISENEKFSYEYKYGMKPGVYHVSGFTVSYVFFQDGKETERANVGECELYGKFTGSENFEENIVWLAKITITPTPITIRALDASKKEKERDPETFGYEIIKGALLDGDTLSGALERESGERVGTYKITKGTLDNSNYSITFEEGTFIIEYNDELRGETTLIVTACLVVGTVIVAFATAKIKK